MQRQGLLRELPGGRIGEWVDCTAYFPERGALRVVEAVDGGRKSYAEA